MNPDMAVVVSDMRAPFQRRYPPLVRFGRQVRASFQDCCVVG